jgi:hypothetical protein
MKQTKTMHKQHLSSLLFKHSFIKKEGDNFYQIKNGDYFNVLKKISEDKNHGFFSKMCKNIIFFKKISRKQADFIANHIIDSKS